MSKFTQIGLLALFLTLNQAAFAEESAQHAFDPIDTYSLGSKEFLQHSTFGSSDNADALLVRLQSCEQLREDVQLAAAKFQDDEATAAYNFGDAMQREENFRAQNHCERPVTRREIRECRRSDVRIVQITRDYEEALAAAQLFHDQIVERLEAQLAYLVCN